MLEAVSFCHPVRTKIVTETRLMSWHILWHNKAAPLLTHEAHSHWESNVLLFFFTVALHPVLN